MKKDDIGMGILLGKDAYTADRAIDAIATILVDLGANETDARFICDSFLAAMRSKIADKG